MNKLVETRRICVKLSSYLTVNKKGDHEIIIQKSRFIGYVKRVESEEDAQSFIQSIQKKHYDATHNCFAYIIGEYDQIQKANDDGEPSGTAGIPILEVLKRQQLKNTAVVITRYFGGVKLGAGGLIRAYSRATREAIQATGVIKRQLMQTFKVTVDYTLAGKLENEVHQSNYILAHTDYMENVSFQILVAIEAIKAFKKWIVDLTNDQASIQKLQKVYTETEVN